VFSQALGRAYPILAALCFLKQRVHFLIATPGRGKKRGKKKKRLSGATLSAGASPSPSENLFRPAADEYSSVNRKSIRSDLWYRDLADGDRSWIVDQSCPRDRAKGALPFSTNQKLIPADGESFRG